MGTEADNVIGTIQLTRTTRLVFSVRPWKGQMLADVRKFVSSEKYEGPTKSGLAMGGPVLMSVIDALTRLKAELQAPRKSIRQVHKAGDTDIMVTVIPPDDLKALPSVDLREYVDSETYTGPRRRALLRLGQAHGVHRLAGSASAAMRIGRKGAAGPVYRRSSKLGERRRKRRCRQRPRQRLSSPGVAATRAESVSGEFLDGGKKTVNLDLPAEPISVVVLPGGNTLSGPILDSGTT